MVAVKRIASAVRAEDGALWVNLRGKGSWHSQDASAGMTVFNVTV